MSYFNEIDEGNGNVEINKMYVDIKNNFGITFIPKFFKILSTNKEVAKGVWAGYEDVLFTGVLPKQIKEMIFLTVALFRSCNYCSATHLAICDMLNVSGDNLDSMKNNLETITPYRTRRILKFAINVIEKPEEITEDFLDELRDSSISDRDISEILGMVFLANTAVNIALCMNLTVDDSINEYLMEKELSTGISSL